jgi:hypothetical protein
MLLFTMLVKQEMDYLALSASLVSIILAAALAARLASRQTDDSPLEWSATTGDRAS